MTEVSTKPYIIRAIYEWCVDSGYTPYIAVAVDDRTQVPREFVKNGEIVLNISPTATNRLDLGNEWIDFQARFGGRARDLSLPVDNVTAIYARETGHGMAFDLPIPFELAASSGETGASDSALVEKTDNLDEASGVLSAVSTLAIDPVSPSSESDSPDTDPLKSGKNSKIDTNSSKRSKNHLVRVK